MKKIQSAKTSQKNLEILLLSVNHINDHHQNSLKGQQLIIFNSLNCSYASELLSARFAGFASDGAAAVMDR